ncbi:MAG: Nramp family divalent metal transporter [Flavobacteriaceae bacterium]|nr:Nramp family divalent metal transporter [Flavobacteriaceae bacterium]
MKLNFSSFKNLGPGLLFAGAAIGVSHLVQSTRAGADFGFGLIWALILVNLFKYPFFQFAPRYTTATGESLIEGYQRLGKGILIAYFILTLGTMFTIQAAVTIVTAGLAANLFGITDNVVVWSAIITFISFFILMIGKYQFLDKLMKIIVIILSLSSIIAVIAAILATDKTFSFVQIIPKGSIEIAFLIAFLGWMPAPLDVSVWQSLWTIEKNKDKTAQYDTPKALFDFNVGYISTIIVGILFIALGALVMFQSGNTFDSNAGKFAQQLISLYTENLGSGSFYIISIAAFTTMISTTITTLDASPRAMAKTTELLFNKILPKNYLIWMLLLSFGTVLILTFFISNMIFLVKIATILSFLTAPFFAIANYTLITSKHTPKEWHPSLTMKILSFLGIIFLIGFSLWFLWSL